MGPFNTLLGARNTMRRTISILLAVVVSLGLFTRAWSQDVIPIDNLAGDYVAIQGTWIVTHNEIAKIVLPEMHGRHFIFRDNQFHLDGDTRTETFVLDEKSDPKRIDFISGSSVIKGIYKLQKNVLTLCTAPPGTARPSRFGSSRDSRVILTIVKRIE